MGSGDKKRERAGESSEAYQKFIGSTKIGYEEWHDGIGYDMEAFGKLTAKEKDLVVESLIAHGGPAFDWRDIEVFQAAESAASVAALHGAMKSESAEARLRAAAALHEIGELADFESVLARELGHVEIMNGLVAALGYVGEKLTPKIRDALLKGGPRERPEVGPHYAAKLYQLIGKSDSDFDWGMRPFFLRFGVNPVEGDKEKAYGELCEMVGMKS